MCIKCSITQVWILKRIIMGITYAKMVVVMNTHQVIMKQASLIGNLHVSKASWEKW